MLADPRSVVLVHAADIANGYIKDIEFRIKEAKCNKVKEDDYQRVKLGYLNRKKEDQENIKAIEMAADHFVQLGYKVKKEISKHTYAGLQITELTISWMFT